jgi:hypothetical protein
MNSPFTPFTPADSGRTELTVGDILPGLPTEVANSRQIPLNQPLHLAEEVVERALSTGQLAIPLFEIYRVCPALFSAPISPEDKRTAPIPPHKIAGLIPKGPLAEAPGMGAGASGASPFAIATPGSAPGFPSGGAPKRSLFSAFVETDNDSDNDAPDATALFQPSPFNFGAPMGESRQEPAAPPQASPGPSASPPGVAGNAPESNLNAPTPGSPNPFAPSSAASFSAMAFGTPTPGSSGSAPHVPTPAQQQAPTPATPLSPFIRAKTVTGAIDISRFAPKAAGTPAHAPAAAPTQVPPSPASNPPWTGGSPFAPPPEPGAAALPPTASSNISPFSVPVDAAPSVPPIQAPPAVPGSAGGPNWMPTPAKPSVGASPFAGFVVPLPAPPTPLQALPKEPVEAAESLFADPAPGLHPAEAELPAPTIPAAGMPAFPGFSPTPAPSQPPPLQSGPFTPAPELARPAPAQVAANMNPFERIQALSRPEAPQAPTPAPAPAPVPEPQAPAASTPTPAPVPASVFASVFAPAPELRIVPSPPSHPGSGSASTPVERVTLSLASVLRDCKTNDIGISPDHIPSWVRVSLPLDLIRPQLLSGKVTLRVTQVVAALDPELRTLITPSRPDLTVDLPLNDLRKALPNEPFPEPAAPAAVPTAPEAIPALFQPFTPSAPPAAPAPVPAPDLVFGTPTTPPPVRPFFEPEAEAKLEAQPQPQEQAQPEVTSSAWPLAPGTPEPEPIPVVESEEIASAFSFLQDEPEIAEATDPLVDEAVLSSIAPSAEEVAPAPAPAEVSAPEPTPVVPAAAAEAATPVLTPIPTPPRPAVSESAGITKSAIRVIPQTSASQSASQMLLRALLNTDEPLDLPTVTQLLACQPGIVAVTCLRDGLCLASAGNGSAEAEHFLTQAPKLHHHVQPLIHLTGSVDTETFSMNSGPLVITFSLQSDLTLGVLHDPRTQGPALRDRITLIARELLPLAKPPASA